MKDEVQMLTRDPVCGAELEALDTAVLASYDGELYAFCSYHCLNAFSDDPKAYAREGASFAHEEPEPVSVAS
jgi:YHS domain-containing protein